jgi:YVTN family beta-propeller protein
MHNDQAQRSSTAIMHNKSLLIKRWSFVMHFHRSLYNMPLKACIALLAIAITQQHANAADMQYHVTERQVLAGPVRWDYLSTNSARHQLFLTRGDHVDMFDTQSKKIVGTIPNTEGVHGVAVADDLDRAYTSNGGTDSVTVFALSTLKSIGTIPVGGKPDSIVYDPSSKRVFAANAKDKSLSVIDANTNQVIKTIKLDRKPETAVVNGTGQLFVAIEDKNAIAIVDTATMAVMHEYDIAQYCDEPAGLAIDVTTDRLFAGCHNAKMAIVDGRTGKVLAAPVIGKGNDATAYDPIVKKVFASNGDGTLTIVESNAPYAVLQTVPTMERARTMALDPVSHQIYLAAAEVADGMPMKDKRPTLKPQTFTLLTVSTQ